VKKQSKENLKSGMVSIVGRPNVGKSTLLNKVVGEKVAIVSRVPQTTRNQIRGIYTDDRGQIVFIDTPGLHSGKDKLDKAMNQSSEGTFHDTDCIIYLVDTTRRIGEEEERIAQKLKSVKVPVILGLNKVDSKAANIPDYIAHWENIKGEPVTDMESFAMIALSAKTGANVEQLVNILFQFLSQGPLLYPQDIVCDVPQKMVISDIIREKLFHLMKDEIPHSLGVAIEHMQPVRKKTLHIKALIFVERDTQKEIVIGKNGQNLKKVGTLARKELEDLLETKIFLELFVKTQARWRDDVLLLQELGYAPS